MYAQPSTQGQSSFLGVGKTDMVGKTSAHPDDSPDAVFCLTLKPRPGGPAAVAIEIRAVAGGRGMWSTAKTRGAGFVGVATSKEPSFLLNTDGGALNLNPQDEHDLLLYVTDDGTFGDKKREYQIKIDNADRTSFTVPVQAQAAEKEPPAPAPSGPVPVRLTAVLKGTSNYDAVGKGKTIHGDDKADGLFVLSVQARDKEITGIEIRNTDGTHSAWDTVPGSENWAIGVANIKDPVKLLNKRDSSVAIPVIDRVDLNLYVADNGSIADGKTHYRVALTFRDGEMAWCPVQTVAPDAEVTGAAETPLDSSTKVNFLGSWLGYMATDAVGPYPGLRPDGKADAVFGLDIEVSPKNYITGIEINSLLGTDKKWGTAGTTPGAWGLAVAYQIAPKALLNKPDGSIKIPVDKRVQFYLYIADPGDLNRTYQGLRIIVHMADGSSFQQMIQRSAGTTSSVVPGVDEPLPPKGVVTCEFRGFIADLVNASARHGKDGYLDGTFVLKLEVEDAKLARVDVSSIDGVVRWSTDPKPPAMLLGAALYPKIYKLINEKPGNLNVPLSGRRTLYLYAADNGMLTDTKSRLTVTVTFADKRHMTTEVIK